MLRNMVTGKVYIGQSIHTWRRWHEHKNSAKRGGKSHLYDAMRKYGAEAFELVILEECAPTAFDEREAHWMAVYDCRNPEKGYNYMPPGQRGRVMDSAMREKLSAINRGKKLPPEQLEKIRIASTGRRHSEEARKKISLGNKGKKKSAAAIEKQKQAQKLWWSSLSEEQKAAWAAARAGRKWSDEERQRASQARKGKPKSPEGRANMLQASKKRWEAYRAAKEAACL